MVFRNFFTRVYSKAYALRHHVYVRVFSGVSPYYIINEYPKSGGTWLAQMLADALDIPFQRGSGLRVMRSVTHGHFLYPGGLRNVVVLWRDPRDLMVSFYYHCFFVNEYNNAFLVRLMKERLKFDDYNDVRGNLPRFISFISTTPVTPSFTWGQFVESWIGRDDVVQTSYEKLRSDTPRELARIVLDLTGKILSDEKAVSVAELNSFQRSKERASLLLTKNVESSFVREGSVGGWRKNFSHESEMLMARYYGAAMQRLGYDDLFVDSILP